MKTRNTLVTVILTICLLLSQITVTPVRAANASDLFESPEAILDEMEKVCKEYSYMITEEQKTLCEAIGKDYNNYADNQDNIQAFYDNALSRSAELYGKLRTLNILYYDMVAGSDEYFDDWYSLISESYSPWDGGMSNYYKAWDGALGAAYSVFDKAITTANVDYSKISTAWTAMYELYSDTWTAMYEQYSDAWGDLYALYDEIFGGFYDDERDVCAILDLEKIPADYELSTFVEPEKERGDYSGLATQIDVEELIGDYTVSSGLKMEEKSDGSYKITGRGSCKDEILVFSSEMDGKKISEISRKAFSGDEATEIVFLDAENIKVKERAFYECDSLEKLVIVNSKVSFDEYCFYKGFNNGLLVVYQSDVKPGEHAFDSSELNQVYILESTVNMKDRVFYTCSELGLLIIDCSDVNVGEYSFYNSGSDMIMSVTSSSLTTDSHGFDSLEIVTFAASDFDMKLDDRSFYNCDSLNSFSLEKGTFSMGEYCFYGSGDDMEITITDCKGTLDDHAFDGCDMVTIVTEATDLECSNRAFYTCEHLTDVSFGTGNLSLGEYSFYGCKKLKNVKIAVENTDQDITVELGSHAFDGLGKLESVEIGYGTVEIGDRAFYNCSKLSSVQIHSSDVSIGDYVTYGCPKDLEIEYYS